MVQLHAPLPLLPVLALLIPRVLVSLMVLPAVVVLFRKVHLHHPVVVMVVRLLLPQQQRVMLILAQKVAEHLLYEKGVLRYAFFFDD